MTYEYECTGCKHNWELEQRITAPAVKTCPKCKKQNAKRLINSSGRFQLSGTGWFNSGGY